MNFLTREIFSPEIFRHAPPNRRQITRHLPYAIILPSLAALHRVRMIAVLLATASVETPRLNSGPFARCDMNVCPRGRDRQRVDLRGACSTHRLPRRRHVAETAALPADSREPGLAHVRRSKQEGCLPGPAVRRRLYSAHVFL